MGNDTAGDPSRAIQAVDVTKLILQLHEAPPSRFGVIVRKKGNEAPLTATISLIQRQ